MDVRIIKKKTGYKQKILPIIASGEQPRLSLVSTISPSSQNPPVYESARCRYGLAYPIFSDGPHGKLLQWLPWKTEALIMALHAHGVPSQELALAPPSEQELNVMDLPHPNLQSGLLITQENH